MDPTDASRGDGALGLGEAERQARRGTSQLPQDVMDGIGMARVPNLPGALCRPQKLAGSTGFMDTTPFPKKLQKP